MVIRIPSETSLGTASAIGGARGSPSARLRPSLRAAIDDEHVSLTFLQTKHRCAFGSKIVRADDGVRPLRTPTGKFLRHARNHNARPASIAPRGSLPQGVVACHGTPSELATVDDHAALATERVEQRVSIHDAALCVATSANGV